MAQAEVVIFKFSAYLTNLWGIQSAVVAFY